MREFFHGWRRKAGLVTLVMALVFVAGWVRSLSVADEVATRINRTTLIASSLHGRVGLGHHVGDFPRSKMPRWNSSQVDTNGFERDFVIQWKSCGVMIIEPRGLRSSPTYILTVPYCYIVIPLTLLSAYLLLGKPRQSTPKKPSDTTPVVGV